MDFKKTYELYAEKAKIKDENTLLANRSGLIRIEGTPSYKEVNELEKDAIILLVKEIDISYYDEYLYRGFEEALKPIDFVKLKFLISFMEVKGISDFDKLLPIFEGIFRTYKRLYESELDFILPHFYVLERLIDLLQNYPHGGLVKPIALLCKLSDNEMGYSGIRTCILKALVILYDCKTEASLQLIKYCTTHFDEEVREEASDMLADLKECK